MFNLFDILQAQAGPGALGFGQQFGLSQDQSRRAIEALLPAFTMGLQRNAANDPTGFAHLFSFLGPNAQAPSLAGNPQMDMLVRQLFGSPHLSQAVLQQASAASGVASPILKQMLPVMAGMVVAGIVHVMINQNQAAAPAPAPASPFGFPAQAWSEMMQQFLTPVGSVPQARTTASRPASATPRPGLASRSSAKVIDNKPSARNAGDTPFDMFQQMFQTGLDVQQENAKAMQQLFDTFWQDKGSAQAGSRAPSDPKPRRAG